MKAAAVILSVCVLCNIGFAQSRQFEKDMKTIWVAHDTASSAESELLTVAQGEKIGRKYKNAWLPYFWSAYCATQCTQYPSKFKDEARKVAFLGYLKQAQENLDRATKLMPKDNNRIQSSAHMLQSLIYAFTASQKDDESEKYRAMYREAIDNAIKADNENPVIMVSIAINLIQEGQSKSNTARILAGKKLLQAAKQVFETFESSGVHRTLTSHYNYEWVGFWLPYTDKLIKDEVGS